MTWNVGDRKVIINELNIYSKYEMTEGQTKIKTRYLSRRVLAHYIYILLL